jgi:hypothetical protein
MIDFLSQNHRKMKNSDNLVTKMEGHKSTYFFSALALRLLVDQDNRSARNLKLWPLACDTSHHPLSKGAPQTFK